MNLRIRRLALLVICAGTLPLFGAWPFDFDAQEQALKAYLDTLGGHWAIESDAAGRVESLTGQAPKLKSLPLPERIQVLAKGAASLRKRTIDEFLPPRQLPATPGTQRFEYVQCHPQCKGGEIVENASILINYHEKSNEYEVLVHAMPAGVTVAAAPPDSEYAEEIAAKALVRDLTREVIEVRRSDDTRERISRLGYATELYGILPTPRASARSDTSSVLPGTKLLAYRGRLSRVQRVRTTIVVVRDGVETVIAERDYDIDIVTRSSDPDVAVVRTIERMQFGRGRGYVFDPNPRHAGKAKFSGRNVPPAFPPYVRVRLQDLYSARRGLFVLQGAFVHLVDHDGSTPGGITNGSSNFSAFPRDERLASVMAYYHIGRMQRYFAQRGFASYRHVPLDIDVDYGKGDYGVYKPAGDNSRAYIALGRSDGIYLAEDADVIAHEYGHMLIDLGGEGRFGVGLEGLAMSEGFSDYLAMSTFAKQKSRNCRELACFAEWLARRCFRRLDEKSSYTQLDTIPPLSHHDNGKIWSAILHEIFLAFGSNRKKVDTLVLTAHINRSGARDEPTMKSVASGMILAARRRDRRKLCAIFDDFDLPVAQCAPYAAAP